MKKTFKRKSKTLKMAMQVDWTCPYCFEKMVAEPNQPKTATIDHVFPTSKGGVKKDFNEVVCCAECNTMKGNLTLQEFFAKRTIAMIVRRDLG